MKMKSNLFPHNMKALQSKESSNHWHSISIMTVQLHIIFCTKNGSKIYLMNLKLFHNRNNMLIKKQLKLETILEFLSNYLDYKRSKKLKNNLYL